MELTKSDKEILKHGCSLPATKGAGAIWDALKNIFETIDLRPEETWVIEADINGVKQIVHFDRNDVIEKLEI